MGMLLSRRHKGEERKEATKLNDVNKTTETAIDTESVTKPKRGRPMSNKA